jgi:hypothetical protein
MLLFFNLIVFTMTKPIRSSIYAISGVNTNYRQFHSFAEFTVVLQGNEDIRSILLMYLVNNVEFLVLKLTSRQDTWQATNVADNAPWFTFTCEARDRINLLALFEQKLWLKLGV